MRSTHAWAAIAAACALAGCASTPPVEIRYFPTTWSVDVTVLRTIGCDATFKRLVFADTVSAEPSFRAMVTDAPWTLKLRSLDGPGANVSFETGFRPDGRLASINGSSEGTGGEVLKAIVGLGTSLATFRAVSPGEVSPQASTPADKDREAACKALQALSADGLTTVTYRTQIGPDLLRGKERRLALKLELNYASLSAALEPVAPPPELFVKPVRPLQTGPSAERGAATGPAIRLQQMDLLTFVVGPKPKGPDDTTSPSTSFQVHVPRVIVGTDGSQSAEHHELPLPSAAFFGKSEFAIELSEAGAVTKLKVGKTSGAGAALGALQSALDPASPAARAERKKAEADLLFQQQRLVQCKLDAAKCPGS